MEVKQIWSLMNTVAGEVLGRTDIVQEDLTGIVDMGTAIFNANAVDKYVKSLVNHVGNVIFVNRPYRGRVPSVLMDGWEFGSVLEKIQAEIPLSTENESWELEDKQSYDPNIFYKPTVEAKFYNSKVTFEVPMSFTEMQVKQSFSSAEQLNGFLSMLYDAVDKAMTIRLDALVMRTINNMTAETLHAEYADGEYDTKTGVRAINLRYLYNLNKAEGEQITVEDALSDPEFIRFASNRIGLTIERMTTLSELFNIGGKARFTPKDSMHIVMLADLVAAANAYLQADTFHDEYTRLPNAETVPFWQASGEAYDFGVVSEVNVKKSDGTAVEASGILCVAFDRNALGVTNMDRRVTSNYNPKAEFYTNWYKMDAAYFNDTNENFVVFFIA